MDAEILRRHDRPVPRYTSYPTAAQFTAAVGPERQRAWLEALPEDSRVAVYVHVPFCRSLCLYCACNTQVVNRHGALADYAALLERELRLVAGMLPRRMRAVAVQWGGGTPTHLGAGPIARVFDTVRGLFDVAANAELSVEIDPRSFGPELARTLAGCGVDRASLGVQDFDPEVQAAIGRVQSFDETRAAADLLRDAGVARLNLDLVYGLPRQTPEGFSRTLERTLALDAQRCAVFGYAHVPWMKPHQRLIPERELPGPESRWRMAEAAGTVLCGAGFEKIGIDHFARPGDPLAAAARAGRLRRGFQGYTDNACDAVLGFGASAVSCLPDGFVQNASDAAAYARALRSGGLAAARGTPRDAADRLAGAVIERLMCDFEADVGALCAAHGAAADRFDGALAALEPFVADGIARREGRRVRMTRAGRPLVRAVCALFDRHFAAAAERHARAV